MPVNPRALLVGALLSLYSAAALTLNPAGSARIEGHAAGTFGTLNDPGGFSGGLAWGPDGTAYTLDGARVLYRWNVQTGRPISRTVLTPPASLPDARANFGPRLLLDGFRADGGALKGPYIRVQGQTTDRGSYQTAYTLRADGRAVLGDICAHSTVRPGGCRAEYSATVLTRTEGRAVVRLEGREGPASEFTLPAGTVLDVEPSPDGERVAALRSVDGGKFDLTAPLFLDVATRGGKVVSRQLSSAFGVQAGEESQVHWVDAGHLLTAAPEKTTPYSATEQRVALWGLSGQQPRWELAGGELRDALPSPDGQFFLTVRGGSVPELRRVSDGSFVRALGAAVTASVPMPGNRALLALDTGNEQGELRVVERSGRQTRLGGVGLGGVSELVVSPDGQRIAAVREDSITVLDASGRTLHTLRITGRVQSLQFMTGQLRSSSLFAQLDDDSGVVGGRGLRWNVATGQLSAEVHGTRPVGPVWLRSETRRAASGAFQSRLVALTSDQRPLWQSAWRTEYSPIFLPSPDGRALVRVQGRRVPGQTEQQSAYLYHLDPRTGRAGPGVLLHTGDPTEAYRGLSLLDFAPDRRHILLGEVSGDGCGGAFYGLRLADLAAAREVALPAALSTGLRRFTGCGQPVPLPTASFTPENQVLVRDGNSLNWWRMTP